MEVDATTQRGMNLPPPGSLGQQQSVVSAMLCITCCFPVMEEEEEEEREVPTDVSNGDETEFSTTHTPQHLHRHHQQAQQQQQQQHVGEAESLPLLSSTGTHQSPLQQRQRRRRSPSPPPSSSLPLIPDGCLSSKNFLEVPALAIRRQLSYAAHRVDIPMLIGCKKIIPSRCDLIGSILVPDVPCIYAEYCPVVCIKPILRFVHVYESWWTIAFCVLAVAANLLMMLACIMPDSSLASYFFQAGLLVMLVVYPVQVVTYNRNMLLEVLKSFEFYFVSGHMLAICAGFLYGDICRGSWFTATIRVPQDLSLCVAVFGMDASSIRRQTKAVLMSVMAMMWFGWTYLLQSMERPGMDDLVRIPLLLKSISVRDTLTTCAFTIAVFCAKYAFASMFQKSDVMMLRLNPRRVDLDMAHWMSYSADSTVPSPSPPSGPQSSHAVASEKRTHRSSEMTIANQDKGVGEVSMNTMPAAEEASIRQQKLSHPSSYRFV